MITLNEKELRVIDRIGDNGGKITQRQIASHTGFSLGLTNLILKKLAKTGYVKVKQLNSKKIHYILTSKGMIEKTQKSYRYIFKTINNIKYLKEILSDFLMVKHKEGYSIFGIRDNDEMADILEIAAKDIPGVQIKRIFESKPEKVSKGIDIMISCNSDRDNNDINKDDEKINLMDYMINKNSTNKI